jgi:multiple sugar transport system permease protein
VADINAPIVTKVAQETTAASAPTARRRRSLHSTRGALGWAYASPTALIVIVFFVFPILLVTQMSVSDWGLFSGNRGINVPENFQTALDHRLLWQAVRFTVQYTLITTVILVAVALGLAMLVQETSRWKSFLRTAVLVPSALGLASASLLFYALYAPGINPLNPLLQDLGLIDRPISYLGTPTAALWSTVFLIVWRFAGFFMLLLLVGLQGISGDIYEAARLDGASPWQIFMRVTLPLLRPSLALVIILCVTGSMLAFDQFYILTKGGPDNSTMTIVLLIYNMAFAGRNNLGLAAALSVMLLFALLLLNALQFRGLRGKEEA